MRHHLLTLLGTLGFAMSPAMAQCEIETFFASNGGGSVGGAIFFDLLPQRSIRLHAIDANFLATAGTPVGLDVYTTPGSYVGNTANPGAWTLVASDNGNAVAAGRDLPTRVELMSSWTLPAGSSGIALIASGTGHAYTNGNGTNELHARLELILSAGAAQNTPWTGTAFTPRVWNGTLHYEWICRGTSMIFGSGCTDSTGRIATLRSCGCPDLDDVLEFTIEMDPSIVGPSFLTLGLSRTQWNGVPLPFDLSPLGAPACRVLVSHDFIFSPIPIGRSGVPEILFFLAGNPGLVGQTMFVQGGYVDPAANSLGVVTTGATEFVIG